MNSLTHASTGTFALAFTLTWAFSSAQTTSRYGSLPLPTDQLIPRFWINPAFPLAKRDGDCGSGRHSCLDIGFGDDCCDNDTYCYVNKDGDPKCCPVGSNCSNDSPCSSTAYFCTRTVTESGTATARGGCCGRKCPNKSLYLCPSDSGGNCCGYDSQCRAGGSCATTRPASRTGLLTPVPEGCTTSQHKCADGGGCCDNWQQCTEVSGTGYCAAELPTSTDDTIIDNNSDDGLSGGAKAGIGVGAVLGAGIIVGGLTWLFLSRRRRQRTLNQYPAGDGVHTIGSGRHDAMTDISGLTPSQAHQRNTPDYLGSDFAMRSHADRASSDISPGRSPAMVSDTDPPASNAAPVEMDSTARVDSGMASPTSASHIAQAQPSNSIHGRFELYGSDTIDNPNRPSSIVPTPPQSPLGDRTRHIE